MVSVDSSKPKTKISISIWLLIVVLIFVLGILFQKSKQKNVNTSSNSVPTKSPFRKFDLKKDLGTITPLGKKNAKVKLVLFTDFECPFCGAFVGDNQQVMDNLKNAISGWEPALPKIISEYVETGRAVLYFRDFPAHQDSEIEHNAARCAEEQGKFWEMHDVLFRLQNEGGVGSDPVSKMQELATNLGLDEEKFNLCLTSKKYQKQIDADRTASRELGVRGTPHMFINNQYVSGAGSFASFKKIIDAELSK
jgi:protein-disulfide isomerase